ncbi:cocaine- and amphetamine-regulated transcript protein [Denticeps clupeoides]|uniref:cocaine- and amphetamine-regulated transcript protein n=1 Tax=Denticeps clupeoides TaxID=299321 RepID=UPI0010A36E51|nr:cocaine- and amphetamine-regulated transcript protein-like [Denticeps clupeoides]
MVCGRILLLSFTCCVWILRVNCEDWLDSRLQEETQELIEALQEVLERLKNTEKPPAEKKLGWVPSCDAGEPCAVRKGARIGKLCACPRGTSCSFSVMKCS